MANLDAPLGLQPVRNAGGGVSPRMQRFTAAASTAIYRGQLVGLNASGLVTGYTGTLAAAGDIIGVAAAYVASAQSDREVPVFVDPDQEYEIQADDASITDEDLVLLRLYKIIGGTTVGNGKSGSTSTGFSTTELDASSGTSVMTTAATNVQPLQLLRPSKQVGELRETTNSKFVVRITPPVHAFSHASDNFGAFSGV